MAVLQVITLEVVSSNIEVNTGVFPFNDLLIFLFYGANYWSLCFKFFHL